MGDKNMKWNVARIVEKAYDNYFYSHFKGADPWFYEVVVGFCKGLTLDVGCGNSCDILSRVSDSLGCDLSKVAIKQSKKRGFEVIQCMGEHLPFKKNAFDSITSLGCLEHYVNRDLGLAEMVRILKLEGRFVLQAERSPNKYQIHLHILWKLAKFFPKQTFNRHLLSKEALLSMFERSGLRIVLVGEQGVLDYSEMLRGTPFHFFAKKLPSFLKCHPYHIVFFAIRK